jgi:hypothetical protein
VIATKGRVGSSLRQRLHAERPRSECDDVAPSRPRPYIGTMHLDLTDDETAALAQELHAIVENDRYPLSTRIRTRVLAKLRPEPVRAPLPPPKVYVPPRATAAKRRRTGR